VTNRALATGVFRAWGLMWWVYVLIGLAQMLNLFLRNPYKWDSEAMAKVALSSQLISLGCEIAIAWFLMSKAAWLATIVFPIEQESGISIGAGELRTVLFAAIGLYFLLEGIQLLAGSGYQLLTRPRGSAVDYLWRQAPEGFVKGIITTIAGAVVLFGPRRSVSGLYERVFGLRDSADGAGDRSTEEK
jgi:hypothetical protein